MKVETTRLHSIDPSGDIVRIKDYDLREVFFHRIQIPELIKLLKEQRTRPKGEGNPRKGGKAER